MMLGPSISLNEIDASLQVYIGNQKCDNVDDGGADDADGDMVPVCRP